MTTAPPGFVPRRFNDKGLDKYFSPEQGRKKQVKLAIFAFSVSLQCSDILGRLGTILRSTKALTGLRFDSSSIV